MKNFLFSNGYSITFDPLGVKLFFVMLAFLLVPSAALAQDDDKPQSEGTLLIAPRLEVEPFYYPGSHEWSTSLGATSFYTFFDGNLGEHFSFSIGNHWLAFSEFSFDDTRSLYQNTWRTDALNWVDWANVTVNFGGFFLTLGKDYLHIGTYEIEEYDYLSHWQINSTFWNNYQVYQWGGRFGWMSEEEDTMISASVTTDQLMGKPFSSKSVNDYAFTLSGMHDFGGVGMMASISQCSIGWLGAMGLNAELSDMFTLGLDGYLSKEYKGISLRSTIGVGEQFDVLLKTGFDSGLSEALEFAGSRFYAGAGAYWYPLKENKDLRVHGLFSYDRGTYSDPCLGLSFGVTYSLNLNIF